MKKFTVLITSALLVCVTVFFPFCAVTAEKEPVYGQETTSDVSDNSYESFLKRYAQYSKPLTSLSVDMSTMIADENSQATLLSNYAEKTNVISFSGDEGSVSLSVSIPEAGLYSMRMSTMPMLETNKGIEFGVSINGNVPYSNAGNFTVSCLYSNENNQKDNRGNDIIPRQIKQEAWMTDSLFDPQGLYDDPLVFAFEKGVNTITLNVSSGAFYIADIELYNTEYPTYAEKLEQWKKSGATEAAAVKPIIIEGESAHSKTDPALIPKSERNSAATSPSSPTLNLLNTISSSKFGQKLTFSFDVDKSGLYKLGMRFSQKDLRGFFVTRRIYIDGVIPFKEFSNVKYFYKNSWQYEEIADDNDNPYLIYLEAGHHELTLEVVLGDFSPVIRELNTVMQQMSNLYRQIIMITGTEPDQYMDYQLEKQIDGFSEILLDMASDLRENGNKMDAISASNGSESAFLYEIADQLESLKEYPETINTRLERYSSNLSSLSSWIFSKQEQPLVIDYISLSSPDETTPKANAGFLNNLLFRVQSVIASFITDYNAVGTVYEGNESLAVWTSGGTDQAGVIKRLIDDMFVQETNIPVNLSLVQGSLLEATFAGQGPDICLNIDRNTVMNLSVRGLLVPLSDKEGYEEVIKDFFPEATVPYTQSGICYALPITETFQMMFYRTDIFEELNLTPPNTWEEFKRTVSVLQSNNMEVGLGIGYDALLLQSGLSYYTEDLSATTFTQPKAVEAFKQWTQFYTQLNLPDAYSFYNRFRTGEMPLGIQPYTEYNQLEYAAPEIKNLWKMVPIPGTLLSDGTVDRSQAGGGSGAIILKGVKSKENAWKFLKWWASADTQARYGQDLENTLGVAARYTPANVNALKQLSWSKSELSELLKQWDEVKEIPVIPAEYYVSRGLTNAFRVVLYEKENPREALFYQNRLINEEITRKREELKLNQ